MDRRKLSVMGFDKDGKIVCWINALGHSQLEYQGIDDIAWDSKNDCLVMLAQKKLLFADPKGKIFDSVILPTYYKGISTIDDQFFLANSTYVNQEHSEYSISIMSKDGRLNQEIIPTLPEYAPFCVVNGTSITTINKSIYFARLFDSNIYEIMADGKFKSKYHIKFDKSEFTPKENSEYDCFELYNGCMKSKQFYALTDIQEGKELLSIKTNLHGVMIIDKSNKTSMLYNYFYDYDKKVPLPNYIPVEYSNGLVFFYLSSETFETFAKQSGDNQLIAKASKMKSNTNPIFLVYKIH